LASDKAVGWGLVVVSVAVILFYAVGLFAPDLIRPGMDQLLVKVTVFAAVAAVFGILAWIGYTLATTPPPKPIEEIEKELEEELKRLEKELKEAEEGQGESKK
jgi:predicted DNA-binding transcriptional regulator